MYRANDLDIDDKNDAESLRLFRSRVSEIPWIEACWLQPQANSRDIFLSMPG